MARRYSRSAGKDVERELRAFKKGKLRSGKGGRGGKVKSRKQAIAIGLSEARKEGKKVPKKTRTKKVARRNGQAGGHKRKRRSRRLTKQDPGEEN